jgi:UPF0755 protein
LKKFKILLFYCFIILLLAGGAGFWFSRATKAPQSQTDQTQIFVIQKGETTDSIVSRLREAGLIKSPYVFKLLLYKEGLIGSLQAGDFRLSPGMTVFEVAQELTHGTLDRWVTIIEGWRNEEIGSYLVNQGFDIDIDYWSSVIDRSNLEGFLFPDTYLIPKDASAAAVIKIFKENFDEKIKDLLPEVQKNGLSLEEVITFASLVEREAKHEEDRSIVAGILIKRWQNGWPLQVDATVQYILGEEGNWWPKITKEDLKVKSLYNTYQNREIPPAPICNPGLSAIKAVVSPKKTDYWYYLSDKDFKMHYASSLEDHQQNIRKYL